MFDSMKLPNIMYFGASKRMDELKGQVFLTPHLGIAALFIIDVDDLFPKGYETQCNLSYDQWDFPNELLEKLPERVNVRHNMVEFEDAIFKGEARGYIHKVDISRVKDKLSLFETSNPDREVIYHGDEPLPILEIIPCALEWDFTFSAAAVKKFGAGIVKRTEERNLEKE